MTKWLVAMGVLVVAAGLLIYSLGDWSGKPRRKPQRERAHDSEQSMPVPAQSLDEASPAPASPAFPESANTPEERAKATPSASAAAGMADYLAQVSRQEAVGPFARLFEVVATEREDAAARDRAVKNLTSAWAERKIVPEAFHVRCSTSLCRGRVVVSGPKDLHKMADIPPPPGSQLAMTDPIRVASHTAVTFYWTRPGVTFNELVGAAWRQ